MADTLDVLSLAEAKDALTQVVPDSKLGALAMYVTAVSRRLDRVVGPVVAREAVDHLDGGSHVVALTSRPVNDITSVVEYCGTTPLELTAETPGVYSSAAYLLDPDAALLYRRAGSFDRCFPYGRRNVVVTYSAGRYTDTATVDPRYKNAAEIMLTILWRRTRGSGDVAEFATFAVPKAVIDLLADQIIPGMA